MTLWGKKDKAADRPKFLDLNNDGSIKQDASGRKLVFLDEAEASTNAAKGAQGAGWYLVLRTGSGETERIRLEKIIAISNTDSPPFDVSELSAEAHDLDFVREVVYPSDASVYTDGAQGLPDPNNRDGWYFINNTAGKKINWYFYDGAANDVKLSDFSAYAVVTIDSLTNDHAPFIGLYTTRQNDGQDAASWYRSRIVYVLAGSFTPGTKYVLYTNTDPGVYPELPRIKLTPTTVVGGNRGPRAGTERVMTVALNTNSASPVNAVKLVAESVGVTSPSYNTNVELRDDASQAIETESGLD